MDIVVIDYSVNYDNNVIISSIFQMFTSGTPIIIQEASTIYHSIEGKRNKCLACPAGTDHINNTFVLHYEIHNLLCRALFS